MGRYLTIYNDIKNHINNNEIITAKDKLHSLLLALNDDYKSSTDIKDKLIIENSIKKLIPVLSELKKGMIGQNTINVLKLDSTKFIINDEEEIIEEENVDEEEVVEETEEEDTEMPQEQPTVVEELEIIEPVIKPTINGNKLSPQYLDDYIGQEKAKQIIKISINAAKYEDRVLEHLLITSSYGLGKTTLASIIANEMCLPFYSINATNLKDTKSLSLFFSKITEECIIFIDEIHALKNDVQTVLLSIITDFRVSFIDSSGNNKQFDLKPFTLIGASTQAGELLKPLLNRFTILELEDYTDEEKDIIVKSKFAKLDYEITNDAVSNISKRSRGVPRTIETFAKGIKDIAINNNTKLIDLDITNQYFEMANIDELGLNRNDLNILKALSEANRPLALVTIESKTGIQKEDIALRYEPYLIKMGLIEKTEKGRILTQKGFDYINK